MRIIKYKKYYSLSLSLNPGSRSRLDPLIYTLKSFIWHLDPDGLINYYITSHIKDQKDDLLIHVYLTDQSLSGNYEDVKVFVQFH